MARMFPGDDGTQPEIEIPDDPSEAWQRIKENAVEEQEHPSEEDGEGSTKDSDETDEEER